MRKSFLDRIEATRPFLVAHRGCTALAPENTVASFECAARLGLHAIETDVRFAGDGSLVCSHDDSLSRMFGVEGAVSEMAPRALRELVPVRGSGLAAWPREALRIPTFGEYLDVCERHGRVPFVETKGDVAVVAPVLAELRRRGLLRVAVLSAIDFAHVAEARRLDDQIFVHHIFSDPERLGELAALGSSGLSYDIPDLSAVPDGLVARVHAAGVKMCLRAGDTPAAVAQMVEMGLDYIPTNATIPLGAEIFGGRET